MPSKEDDPLCLVLRATVSCTVALAGPTAAKLPLTFSSFSRIFGRAPVPSAHCVQSEEFYPTRPPDEKKTLVPHFWYQFVANAARAPSARVSASAPPYLYVWSRLSHCLYHLTHALFP